MEQRANVAKRITVAVLVTSFAYAFVNSITSVLVNDVVEAFSLTGASQGLMSSMMSLGMMIALLVNPLFQGRIGKITMILLSGGLQAVMLLLSAGSPNVILFMTSVVCIGIGCGWMDGYMNSTMIDAHPKDNPKYLGLLHGLFGIGSLLAPIAMQWLLGASNWRWVNVATAALMLAAMAMVFVSGGGKKTAGMFSKTQEERLTAKQLGAYLKNGKNLLLLGCAAMTSILQTGVICWIVRYMFLAHNAAALGASCLTIFWIAATVNRFITPRLKARPIVLVLIGALLDSAFLGIGILSGNALVMCVCVGLIGLCTGHFVPMVVSECAEGYHGSTTLTTSIVMFVMGITRVIVPILMAALTDRVSVQIGMAFPIISGILAAACCVGVMKLKGAKTNES